ncbi:MAG: HpcH/HpaI aldolase family protein [Lentisphaeria bacterium]|jgi:2-keto-3-deoxy-L-rhamnonate aldolase RhmA
MKPNRFKKLYAEGKMPVGHMLFEFTTRGIPEILEVAGADFVIIDMEHSAFNIADTANLISWFRTTDIAVFVRVPEVHYSHIARVMDSGAHGVMAPNVKTVEQAQALVDAAKYQPIGQRGCYMGLGPNTDYRAFPPLESRRVMDEANELATVICLIEHPEGVANVDAIAALPGVDALCAGYADLAQYMGIPGEFQNPQFLDAMQMIAETAKRHDIPAIVQPGNEEQLEQWLGLGYTAISWSCDIAVYRDALKEATDMTKKAVGR